MRLLLDGGLTEMFGTPFLINSNWFKTEAMLKKILVLSFVFAAGCAFHLTLSGFYNPMLRDPFGMPITIINLTSRPISDLELQFQGGASKVDLIPAQKLSFLRAGIKGNSGMNVRYIDCGSRVEATLNVYIETGFRGSVEIAIYPNRKVECKKVSPFPV